MIDNVITDVEKAVTRPCQLIYSFKKKSPLVYDAPRLYRSFRAYWLALWRLHVKRVLRNARWLSDGPVWAKGREVMLN